MLQRLMVKGSRQIRLKAVLLAAIVAAGVGAHAASVRYGDATYDGTKLSLYDATPIGGGNYWMGVGPYLVDQPSIVALAFYDSDTQYLIRAVEAESGDFACKEYFDSQTSFFMHSSLEESGEQTMRYGTPGYGVVIDSSKSSFIAYHIEDKSLGDIYGWVEFGIVNDKVSLLNSAIDLGGSSIDVGPVPEPSSALLLLLGAAGLALSRKCATLLPHRRRTSGDAAV